jgi:spoIIIJ-associated protein
MTDDQVRTDEEAGGVTAMEPEVKGGSLLDREGDAAADYLEGLLDIADLDGDIDIDVEGNRAMVSVVEVREGDLRHLVGEKGETLDAIQELTRLAAARETGERSRLMLDIAGYRAARRAALVVLAKAAIAEAERTGAPITMDPMTPFERKVVHDAVAEAGLMSESEGDEPRRCVVIRVS